jgi:hypothetical protein
MPIFRFYVATSAVFDPDTVFEEVVPIEVSETRIVGGIDDSLYLRVHGRFSFASDRAFSGSPIDRIVLSTDREGSSPLFAVERVGTTVGEIARDPNSLFAGNDLFIGSPGDDELTFFAAPELGRGNDTMRGGAGDDALHGGLGSDQLFGEGGDDTLFIGPGKADRATGGEGGDTFVLLGGSRGSAIRDFDAGSEDRLELHAAELFTDADAARADPAGFVRFLPTATGAKLQLDTDGGADSFVTWTKITGDLGSTDLDALIAAGTVEVV